MKGEARGVTIVVALVCALAVWSSVNPDVDRVIGVVVGVLFGGAVLVGLAVWGLWLLADHDRHQPVPQQTQLDQEEADQ